MALRNFGGQKPKGKRIGGPGGSGTKPWKPDVSIALVEGILDGRQLFQKRDLAPLLASAGLKNERALGDFLGKGRGGLDLELIRDGRDWRIDPSGWQAFKAWEWLESHVPNLLEIANRLGYPTVKAVEDEIKHRCGSPEESTMENAVANTDSGNDSGFDVVEGSESIEPSPSIDELLRELDVGDE